MSMDNYCFQYCQKIVVFSQDRQKVLLCERKGEADYDGTFSFIGGKMETSDESILAGLQREKNEEVGENFKIKILTTFTHNVLFKKKDGSSMILPHYLAVHESGEVELNEEYSEFKWVKIEELKKFEPKIPGIDAVVTIVVKLEKIGQDNDYVLI